MTETRTYQTTITIIASAGIIMGVVGIAILLYRIII